MTTKVLNEKQERIRDLHNDGKSVKEIAQKLKMTPGSVSTAISRLRKLGHLPPATERHLKAVPPAPPAPPARAVPDSVEEHIDTEITTAEDRLSEIGAELSALNAEQSELTARRDELTQARDCLAASGGKRAVA